MFFCVTAAISLLAMFVVPAGAQDYRASVLYLAAAESSAALPGSVAADSAGASASRDSSSARSTNPAFKQPSLLGPIAGGVTAGFAGVVVGGLLGNSFDDYNSDDIPEGAILGLLAGEMLLMPIGVHLGNGRHGSFLADLAMSIVLGVAVTAATVATDDGSVLILGTAAQIASTIAIERGTAAKRARDRP
jgi:hypothetical protein